MPLESRNRIIAQGIGALGGVLAVGLALVFAHSQPRTFPLDDAYIHLAYGKSLAFHGTLGLNPGEPSLGTSSPLWALVLVPLFWIFRDPYWSVHFVSLASVVGYIVIGTTLLHDALAPLDLSATERRVVSALGALLLSANGSLIWMSLSGMETCLVLFLCIATIKTYGRFGPGVVLGVVMGLCLLGRSTSVALLASILFIEALDARRIRKSVVTVVTAFAVCAPYGLYSWRISGSAIPNTAKGKLLTYVRGGIAPDEWAHYLGRVLAFHKYLLAYPLLGVALLVAGLTFVMARRRAGRPLVNEWRLRISPAFLPIAVMSVWAVVHVAQYMLAFRTIGQQGRYLAEWTSAIAITGSFAVGYCVSFLSKTAVRVGAPLAIAGAHLLTLPYWVSVYRNNLAHVENTYVKISEYIRDKTPADARIASFDIGTIRYLGDRYIVDLGGLVDASTHDCLKLRSCGEYVRKHDVGYLMYPKDPESDKLTGVQQAEFAPRYVLRELFMKQFSTPDYDAPTLTHSFRLQLFKIDGWFDRRSTEGAVGAFRLGEPNPELPIVETHFNPDGDLEVVGYRTDVTDVRYIREYPYTLTLWLSYRAVKPLKSPKWVHVSLFDDELNHVIASFDDLATGGVVLPATWPVGEVLEEHRILDIPWDMPNPRYHLRVSVTSERLVDFRYPDIYPWIDIGEINVVRSKTTALSPL